MYVRRAIMGNPILESPRISRNEVCYYGEPAAGIPEDKKKERNPTLGSMKILKKEPDAGIPEDIKRGTRCWDLRNYYKLVLIRTPYYSIRAPVLEP